MDRKAIDADACNFSIQRARRSLITNLPRLGPSGPGALETYIVSSATNWQPIAAAEKGIGPLLLRDGAGPNDPAYVGYQADDGRWFFGDAETHPTHYCLIPLFDADDRAAA